MVFSRANNLEKAARFIVKIFSSLIFAYSEFHIINTATIVLILVEWMGRNNQSVLANLSSRMKPRLRFALYYDIIIIVFWVGGKKEEFINFRI